jgi:hypothetical protein
MLFDVKAEQHNAEYTMNGRLWASKQNNTMLNVQWMVGCEHVLCDAKAEQHNAEYTMNGGLRTCVVWC